MIFQYKDNYLNPRNGFPAPTLLAEIEEPDILSADKLFMQIMREELPDDDFVCHTECEGVFWKAIKAGKIPPLVSVGLIDSFTELSRSDPVMMPHMSL